MNGTINSYKLKNNYLGVFFLLFVGILLFVLITAGIYSGDFQAYLQSNDRKFMLILSLLIEIPSSVFLLFIGTRGLLTLIKHPHQSLDTTETGIFMLDNRTRNYKLFPFSNMKKYKVVEIKKYGLKAIDIIMNDSSKITISGNFFVNADGYEEVKKLIETKVKL